MSQILSSPESTFHMKGETVTFMSDGALSFSSLDAEQVFKAYVASGASTIRSTFQGRDAPEDSFGDPAFMLLLAFKLRDTGRRQQAKLVFGTGMKLHPEYPAEYGGPAFQKELLRMLLAERDWAVADNVRSRFGQRRDVASDSLRASMGSGGRSAKSRGLVGQSSEG